MVEGNKNMHVVNGHNTENEDSKGESSTNEFMDSTIDGLQCWAKAGD